MLDVDADPPSSATPTRARSPEWERLKSSGGKLGDGARPGLPLAATAISTRPGRDAQILPQNHPHAAWLTINRCPSSSQKPLRPSVLFGRKALGRWGDCRRRTIEANTPQMNLSKVTTGEPLPAVVRS